MPEDDDIDRRAMYRARPSYGPAWEAAIEFGVDVALLEENLALTPQVALLEENLALTPQQRLEALIDLIRLAEENDRARAALHGATT